MAYIGNNPKLKSIVSSGDSLANLTAEPRVAGRLAYATDEGKFYWDDGVALAEVGAGGFNAVQPKATLDALARVQGKIYYATDEDKVYTDDGSQLNELGGSGSGVPLLTKGSILTSDGSSNGELVVGLDGQAIVADSAEASGLKYRDLSEVPTSGTDGHFLRKTLAGSVFEAIRQVTSGGGNGQVLTSNGSGGYSWVTPVGGGMNYAGSVNQTLNSGQTYTIPANQAFEGHVIRQGLGAKWDISGSGGDGADVAPMVNHLSLGAGNTINAFDQTVRVVGYRMS